jgi:multicomponent Na+:H+ antiporter subunit F
MNWTADFLAMTVQLTTILLVIGMMCALVRLVRGPSLPDRVVALDMFASLVVAIIAIDAIATAQIHFLRAAIVVALVMFLGTVAFAFYVLRGGTHD